MINVKDIEMKKSDSNENSPETFLAYNEAISTLQAVDMQYEEATKNMCLVGVYAILGKIYNLKEVYCRVLEFMMENEMYEKYLPSILELQFNPPSLKTSEGNGEIEDIENKTDNPKQEGKGGIGTKTDESTKISDHFIRDLYKDEDDE